MPPVGFLGPQVRVSADTIVSLPGRAVSVVNPDGTLTDRLHQYLYTVGTTINNVSPGGGYAPLTSPAFQGVPTVPTPAVGITSAQAVNAAWVAETFAAPPPLGSGTANTVYSTGGALNGSLGMATPGPVAATSLSNNTASGSSINATLGAATPAAASVTTLAASGLITPTSTIGIAGTVTNDNAAAGSIGEYVEADGTETTASGTNTNVAQINLGAGDWDIAVSCNYVVGAGATMTGILHGASATSLTFPNQPDLVQLPGLSEVATSSLTLSCMPVRFSLAAAATIFLVGRYAATGGTVTMTGHIRARRMR